MKTKLLTTAIAFLLGMGIQQNAHADLKDGLVAHYCFDDATNIGKDCSTNGNNGTAIGQVNPVDGLSGKAANFGGYNNPASIHIPNSASLQFAQDFSVSFAVKMTSFEGMDGWGSYSNFGAHGLISKSHDRTGMALLGYGDSNTGNIGTGVASFEWSNNGVGGMATDSSIGKWVNFTYVFSNSQQQAKLFANGILVGTKDGFSQSFASINSEDLYLGKYSDSWYPLNGSLDDVRIYNRALTEVEVLELYSGVEPQTGIVDLNVTITKPSTIKATQKATYKINVVNNGKATATEMKVNFVVPGKTFVTVDIPQNCTASGRIVECTISDLAPKQKTAQSFSMTVWKKGALNVGAGVSANEDDTNEDNNETSAVISVK